MAAKMEFLKSLSLAMVFLVGVSTAATSQEQAETTTAPSIIAETFDGDDHSLMLGGQIDFQKEKSPWLVYVTNGNLVMENRQSPQSLHYNDITWVKFPGSELLESTENLVISTVVDAENTGNGGAGLIVGSGKAGVYLMFSVDGQGRFHILQKDGRKLRSVHSATHPAINTDEPNQLSFEVRGAHVAFLANGAKVIQIPYPSRMSKLLQQDGQAGIGLAAFGIGTFRFESVEIARPD